jgi:minor extracellular serine protease Vpr
MFAGGGIVAEEGVWAVGTTNAHGVAIRALVTGSDDEVTATFTDRMMQVANPRGGLLSDFSSYGMTPDMKFRPDITAPGGLIESTYPLASGGYATISGTSMSAPHVAGGVALLLEARPELATDEVRGVLQNSADPLVWSLNPATGLLDHTFRQGAGMMRIDESITATTAVSPSRIALGESEVTEVTLHIANTGSEEVTYTLDHEGTLGTAGWGTLGFETTPGGTGRRSSIRTSSVPTSEASFSEDSVTLEPGGSTTVDVTIVNPHYGLYAHQAGGYLTVTSDDDRKVVPYAGLAGQIADIEIWPEEREAALGLENQLVARWTDEDTLVAVDPGHVFDRDAGEEPVAAVFMGFAAERLEIVAHHVATGYEVPVAEVDFARRSASEVEYIPYTWDGREQVGNSQGRRPAPRGEWRFDVRALMPRVDPTTDPEVWVEDSSYSFQFDDGAPARQPGRGGPPPGRGPNR